MGLLALSQHLPNFIFAKVSRPTISSFSSFSTFSPYDATFTLFIKGGQLDQGTSPSPITFKCARNNGVA